jgi:Plant mobile domain
MQPDNVLDCIAHRPVIPFDKRCEYALKNLRIYEVVQIQHIKTDHMLITMLVEWWCLETHTFHMPVGKLTVTLQDVSCLWGLPTYVFVRAFHYSPCIID